MCVPRALLELVELLRFKFIYYSVILFLISRFCIKAVSRRGLQRDFKRRSTDFFYMIALYVFFYCRLFFISAECLFISKVGLGLNYLLSHYKLLKSYLTTNLRGMEAYDELFAQGVHQIFTARMR